MLLESTFGRGEHLCFDSNTLAYTSRYSKRCGRIMLKGQERKLTAAQIDSQTITALSLEKGFQLIKPHIEENGR